MCKTNQSHIIDSFPWVGGGVHSAACAGVTCTACAGVTCTACAHVAGGSCTAGGIGGGGALFHFELMGYTGASVLHDVYSPLSLQYII